MEYRGIVREHKLWIKIVALIVAGLVIYRSIVTEQWIYILIGIVVFLACFFTKEHIVDEKGADIRYHLFGMNISSYWSWGEITEMQTRAILGAALELKKEGVQAIPEIMVPLTGILYEFANQERIIRETAALLFEEEGDSIDFKVGTMIEIPRAALTANRIASKAEFFSFGTNDLTQMTFGYSRDDISTFLPAYLDMKILKNDPFQVLDQNGVGQLIEMATEKGRSVRPDLKCGICGEHGGEPSSVEFCHRVGLNYVSCSPFRVPIARLAAAQAALKYGN